MKKSSNSNTTDRKELATRRDEPVVCATCEKTIERRMRGQKYCSRKCRERGRERCRKAFLGHTACAPATPKKNRTDSNALAAAQRRGSHEICGPAKVIESECYAGREWKSVVSPDGVKTLVARWRKGSRNG
jgi:hypothetical protein